MLIIKIILIKIYIPKIKIDDVNYKNYFDHC